MRSTSYQHSSYTQRAPARRRIAGLLLALVANLLLVAMLLRMGPSLPRLAATKGAAIFNLLPERREARVRGTTRPRRSTTAPPRTASPRSSAAVAAAPVEMMTLSREEFAASDISRLPSHAEDREAGAGDEGGWRGKGGEAGEAGGGPNGERLYEAQWYREPTHAELAFYLPPGGAPPGWAVIACQTVEKYRVDNCRELGDSPPGSGLAGAMRRAAWQFLVRPPRIGGRTLIGAWVRIRIDFRPDGAIDP